MKYKPHEYQTYATRFLLEHPISCLMLDCGLGKTVITLTALWDLVLDSFDIGRVLVIAPKRVAENVWVQEIEKWEHLTGLTAVRVLGNEQERRSALNTPAFLYIINRENVAWLVKNRRWDFDMVVIDELSSFKSHQAQRFKAMRKVRPLVTRIVGLTATPAPNSLMDLWAEMCLLDMGQRLGRYIGSYRERFFVPDKRNREIVYSYKPREGAEDKIYESISDICISMKAKDHLQMPELVTNRVTVSMSPKEHEVYDRLRRDMVTELNGEELDAVNAASLSNKLQQMASGAVYSSGHQTVVLHSRKLDALEDLIEAANGKPLLVAYWFHHEHDRLHERFDCRDINTAEDIAAWCAGEIPVGLIHPASAGHGLNLQSGGSTLVWFSLTWSLELYEQLNDRLWRQGQEHTVVIHHIISEGTIDEDIMSALARKDVGQNALRDAVKARLEV
ncbi:SNF2-related protein [Evtepia sp.]|uniref:SNF2-related protein n=1 Tax=Evtepia sp. TaxID=2773933 RepID=UPI0039904FCE